MLRRSLFAGLLLATLSGCGGGQPASYARTVAAGGPSARIEERALSDRPPLAIIQRTGDPEGALAFASLAAATPELHAAFGELLNQRLTRAGYQTMLVSHGLGFELMVLTGGAEQARGAARALLQALTQPISANEIAATGAGPGPGQEKSAPSAVAQCSGELSSRRRINDAAELERERQASFARDRAAWAVVGEEAVAAAVADALLAGPDWPERGAVRSTLPQQGATQILRGEKPTLSVALTVPDANRALAAAERLGEPNSALGVRLAALGGGLRLRRVTATAHPSGACVRLDSDVDATPAPDARRLGFAIYVMSEEAELSLSAPDGVNRLEANALSASDPRQAARAAAYAALVQSDQDAPSVRVVALTTPDEAPLAPSIDAAAEQARAEAPQLDAQVRVETGQPGVWALLSTPCAAFTERADNAGSAAVLFGAAAAASTHRLRLEPWVGAEGVGILGFAERAPGETDADAAARLGSALGRAVVAPPSAVDVASARADLLQGAGDESRPLLNALLESLAPGHLGALAPRGNATTLQVISRETVLARQRELLRLPHRLAILSPTNAGDAAFVTRSVARWLKTPDAPRPSPCGADVAAARGELSLPQGAEGNYVAFRFPAKAFAEAGVLAEILNAPNGALARALAEPDLVGAARAKVFGTASVRALVVQVSAFDGRDAEAISRVQRLFERLSTDGVLASAEIEAALGRLRAARRLSALDPRYRLVQLLDASVSAAVDAAAVRRLASTLRPDAAVVARTSKR